jgi:RNA polymerase sigma-70 factor (ECF subfamily)
MAGETILKDEQPATDGGALDADELRQQLETAVMQYQSPLLRYAIGLLPDRPDLAQDVVQEAFLKLRKALQQQKPIRQTSSWLFRVTHNLAVDTNRRENRLVELDDSDHGQAPTTTADPGQKMARDEAKKMAVAEMHKLPEQEREILLLKLVQQMTLQEISDMTGVGLSTVHYRLNAGLRRLAGILKDKGAV